MQKKQQRCVKQKPHKQMKRIRRTRRIRRKPTLMLNKHLITWMCTEYIRDNDDGIRKIEMYGEYHRSCMDSRKVPIATNMFGKYVTKIYPGVKRRRLGGSSNQTSWYWGIRRATPAEKTKLISQFTLTEFHQTEITSNEDTLVEDVFVEDTPIENTPVENGSDENGSGEITDIEKTSEEITSAQKYMYRKNTGRNN